MPYIWSDVELQSYIDEGYDQVCRLTLALWRRGVINNGIGEVQGQATYDLPTDFFEMDRVTWDHKRIDPVHRAEIEFASPSYETLEGETVGYIMEEDGVEKVRLWRVPHEDGTKVILEYYALPTPLADDNDVFEIPVRYVKYIRHYAMWKALERNGPGQDLKLAEHYHQRWMAGIARMIFRRHSMNTMRVAVLGGTMQRKTGPPRPKMPSNYGTVVS